MENKYFTIKETLYEITSKYEEAIELLVVVGFENIRDPKQRATVGKAITLETALKMKKINIDNFVTELIEKIEEGKANSDEDLKLTTGQKAETVKIEGILPCPVRIPLMEGFAKWIEENEDTLEVNIEYELKAASMGVDWIKESIEKSESADVLADIFISAGFDLFFDRKLIGKYKEAGVFEDVTDFEHYNKDFENDYMSLKDPDKQYSIIGVVPAVFLVNVKELGDRAIPQSWEEVLSGDFEGQVSLPVGDFDLFNAIILNIYKKYGEEGVVKLGKTLLKSMHPSQMVKSHVGSSARKKPVVTIMPYFFTKMTKKGGPMEAVWPSDGAVISPIFLLSKKEKNEKLKPIIDFFASKEVGEILSHNGRFPSVNPEVDNRIPKEQKYMWLGWDYIKANDMGQLIDKCWTIFNDASKEA